MTDDLGHGEYWICPKCGDKVPIYSINYCPNCNFDKKKAKAQIISFHKQGLTVRDMVKKMKLKSKIGYKYIGNIFLVRNLSPNYYKFSCEICGKISQSQHPKAIYCSDDCRKLGRKKVTCHKTGVIYVRNCLFCGSEFKTKSYNKIFCSKECRIKRREITVDGIREEFKLLAKLDPGKAQKIADEMEIFEGEKFRDLVLDGLAPFRNPKKYKKNPE